LYVGPFEFNPVFIPEPVFVGFGVFVLHMAHIYIHECRSGKEVVGFGRDDRDAMIASLPDVTGGSNARDAVAYNDNVFHNESQSSKVRKNGCFGLRWLR
jgi:hypothetical protein